jgi:hypothetical protein
MSDEPLAQFARALADFQANPAHRQGPARQRRAVRLQLRRARGHRPEGARALANHGLSWTAKTDVTDAGFILVSSLLHVGGHRESATYPLPDPSKANPQQIGSAITYGRRYTFTASDGCDAGR